EVVATFPEGTVEDASIRDVLPTGTRFLQCAAVDPYVADADLDVETPGCTNTGSDTNLTFDFGDVANAASAGSTSRTITIRYDVLVENVGANARGMARVNAATMEFTGGEAGPAATTVTLVEPTLQIQKSYVSAADHVTDVELADAQDRVGILIGVTHTGASNATAFEVALSDVLDDNLQYVAAS